MTDKGGDKSFRQEVTYCEIRARNPATRPARTGQWSSSAMPFQRRVRNEAGQVFHVSSCHVTPTETTKADIQTSKEVGGAYSDTCG